MHVGDQTASAMFHHLRLGPRYRIMVWPLFSGFVSNAFCRLLDGRFAAIRDGRRSPLGRLIRRAGTGPRQTSQHRSSRHERP